MFECSICHKRHRNDSEECEQLRNKTYKQNDYPISVLLGENIISHIGKVLKNPECENQNNKNQEDLSEMVNNLINLNPIIRNINDRLVATKADTRVIKEELRVLAESDQKITERVGSLSHEFESFKVDVTDRLERFGEANMRAHASNGIKQDELSKQLKLIFDHMQSNASVKDKKQPKSPLNKRKRDKNDNEY